MQVTNMIDKIGVHIEITSNCNSRCLDCGRFVKGTDVINPYVSAGSSGNMSFETFKNSFDQKILQNMRYVNFTGTYGEATMHPSFLEFLIWLADSVDAEREIREKNGHEPTIQFMIETNGGTRDVKYWSQLSEIVASRFHKTSRIIFGIDGIDDDTHQKYRRGIDFNRCIEHAKACINNGVRTEWSMIEFSHNEHQFDDAERLANKLGFWKFKKRRSRLRNVIGNTATEIENVQQKKKNISTDNISISSTQSKLFNQVKKQSDSVGFFWDNRIPEYINETKIECEWKNKKQISIDYTGRVWQCCYFSTFYHSPVEFNQQEFSKKIDFSEKTRDYENLAYYENNYDENWNNINTNTLSKILEHRFFINDLPDSFGNKTDSDKNPRIYRCAKHCGDKNRKIDSMLNNTKKE